MSAFPGNTPGLGSGVSSCPLSEAKWGSRDEGSQMSGASIWLDCRQEYSGEPWEGASWGNRVHGDFPSPGSLGCGFKAEKLRGPSGQVPSPPHDPHPLASSTHRQTNGRTHVLTDSWSVTQVEGWSRLSWLFPSSKAGGQVCSQPHPDRQPMSEEPIQVEGLRDRKSVV